MSETEAERVLIVGAGLAGVQTAAELRAQGWPGHITLLGAEPHPPYDRPPLSKQLLAGEPPEGGERVEVPALEVDFASLGVELLLGRTATGLRTAERLLDTDAGPLPYDHLVLATGAEAVRLPGSAQAPGVHLLRTLDDARALRAALAARGSLVVIGAGWIGAEVATAATAAGCRVTVVEAAPQPLPGALPAEVTEPMRRWYAEAGAELHTGRRVRSVGAGRVELADGGTLRADVVLVGVGSRPATGWLAGSGVALGADGAVLADERLRASVPGVYAVGDCASYPSARYGERLLIHHWDNALSGPRTVAANIRGEAASHDPVPYFWSEQFGRYVQFLGRRGPADRLVWRGDPWAPESRGPGWAACWLGPNGELTALLAVDRPRDVAQGRRLAERATPLDEARVADPAVPLRSAVRPAG